MALALFANNANTTLASGIASGTTTIVVASGTGVLYPSPSLGSYFAITLNDALTGAVYEVCYCTSRTGDSLTVSRGQEGTTARSWLLGDFVYGMVTAGELAQFEQQGNRGAQLFQTSGPFTVPPGVFAIYVELWGGGGGSSGLTGASGAAGGYCAGWLAVTPGQTIAAVCGTGGVPGNPGGNSSFSTLSATGGPGGGAGAFPGGVGVGGAINIQGGGGTDLTDTGSYVQGAVGNAIGGNAPRGGLGGSLNAAGVGPEATAPGAGGGSNSASSTTQPGANGWVYVTW